MILPRLLRLIGLRDYNNCWFFIHLNSFWGCRTHTGADLNITWIFTFDSWLKTCWNDTWETQNGSFSCDAHISHMGGGFNIGRACQSIPAMNKGMQRASKMQSQKSHFLLLPWFPDVIQPISAPLPHTGRHPDSSWDKDRVWRSLIEAAWDTVRLPVVRLFLSSHQHLSVYLPSFICFVSIVLVFRILRRW